MERVNEDVSKVARPDLKKAANLDDKERDKTWLTSIKIVIVSANSILLKLIAPLTMEAQVVSDEAANMACSRRRRRDWFFSWRSVRTGKKMSRASATIAALYGWLRLIEGNTRETHRSFERWALVPGLRTEEPWMRAVHTNVSRSM